MSTTETTTDPAEAAFREALRERPGDATTRLVYADWLDEHGRADEAFGQRWQAANGKYPELATDGRWYWWKCCDPAHACIGHSKPLYEAMCQLGGGYTTANHYWYLHATPGSAEQALAEALAACRAAGEKV